MNSLYTAAHNRCRGIFFLHGAGFASWVPHIPLVQQRLALSHENLGLALLAAAVGVVAAMPLAARCSNRFGSNTVVKFSGVLFFPALVIPLFMASLPTLAIALFVMGFCAAMMDIAMNANGVSLERARDKSILSGLHGFWSLGGFCGAGFATLWFTLPLSKSLHLPISAIILLAAHWYLQRGLLSDLVKPADHHKDIAHQTIQTGNQAIPNGERPIFWLLLPFGICAFVGQFGEGVITDWVTVLMIETHDSTASIAAAGFALYSAAMAITRLSGDWLVMRLGRAPVLIASCGLATTGYLIIALSPHYLLSWLGCFITGTGLAVILPLLISTAAASTGKSGGTVVATIAATGYTALMAGPPVIGAVAERYGLINAFLLTSGFLSLIIPVYLTSMRQRLKTVRNS
ncbi:MFS transporter [uncultured Thalassospira sp.]|uniref:MFS transporter n=1 Tax=uncultured Thalassospira sp. TaxID=404382 RepID=UPI0030D924B7|tara:strand:- start:3056 stop:4264 length:1209 start_codon:yes stop_codon:yes gene_type:complete